MKGHYMVTDNAPIHMQERKYWANHLSLSCHDLDCHFFLCVCVSFFAFRFSLFFFKLLPTHHCYFSFLLCFLTCLGKFIQSLRRRVGTELCLSSKQEEKR
ncbi:uncharacterized protein BYT42DRAFT_368963 [Radiomyces spectabilis]|uniref:uncharacterized protein n=1 Tax=Radiomyces spectabilis TaxID=64574 RepID=UPI0022201B1B|nr:uncharacterized protein BYT42DRAFT_368963 [Radiomyces spectabilis]KAI8375960.1 hypothetical protein BYT42DRAFT_368963 [Radiomyces spectabilis]